MYETTQDLLELLRIMDAEEYERLQTKIPSFVIGNAQSFWWESSAAEALITDLFEALNTFAADGKYFDLVNGKYTCLDLPSYTLTSNGVTQESKIFNYEYVKDEIQSYHPDDIWEYIPNIKSYTLYCKRCGADYVLTEEI